MVGKVEATLRDGVLPPLSLPSLHLHHFPRTTSPYVLELK